MTTPNPFDYLCWYDSRYTDYVQPEEDDEPGNRCGCDNCFYGRTALALEILRLREIVTEFAQVGFDGQGYDPKWLDDLLNNKEMK